jgi:hypothetical protein
MFENNDVCRTGGSRLLNQVLILYFTVLCTVQYTVGALFSSSIIFAVSDSVSYSLIDLILGRWVAK